MEDVQEAGQAGGCPFLISQPPPQGEERCEERKDPIWGPILLGAGAGSFLQVPGSGEMSVLQAKQLVTWLPCADAVNESPTGKLRLLPRSPLFPLRPSASSEPPLSPLAADRGWLRCAPTPSHGGRCVSYPDARFYRLFDAETRGCCSSCHAVGEEEAPQHFSKPKLGLVHLPMLRCEGDGCVSNAQRRGTEQTAAALSSRGWIPTCLRGHR